MEKPQGLDASVLTLEKLQQTMRELEVEQDARDLDMFLSDDWPVYKILRSGGAIIQTGGKFYAVDRKFLSFSPCDHFGLRY